MREVEREEFQQWLDLPITRWVLEALAHEAAMKRDHFMQRFFENNECDPYEMALARGEWLGLISFSVELMVYDRLADLHTMKSAEEEAVVSTMMINTRATRQ